MTDLSSKRVFDVGGQDQELFISFAVQQQLLSMCGGLDNIGSFLTDVLLQTNALALIIFGREFRTLKTYQDVLDALEDKKIEPEAANEIVSWIQEYLINFTEAQAKALSKKYDQQIQKLNEQTASDK